MGQEEILRTLAERFPERLTVRQTAHAAGVSTGTANEQMQALASKGRLVGIGKPGTRNFRYVPSLIEQFRYEVERIMKEELRKDRLRFMSAEDFAKYIKFRKGGGRTTYDAGKMKKLQSLWEEVGLVLDSQH